MNESGMKAKEVELNPFLFWTNDSPKTLYFVTLYYLHFFILDV